MPTETVTTNERVMSEKVPEIVRSREDETLRPSHGRPVRPGDLRPAQLNPIPKAAGKAVASLFPQDPQYMDRGPFSYTDAALVERDLRAAGFEDIELETVELSSRVAAHDAAQGIVLGSPLRAEIERLEPSALERAVTAVAEALRPWDGKSAPTSAHIATATR